MQLRIRPIAKTDQTWIEAMLQKYWRSTGVVSRGHLHQTDQLPGFVAGLWGQNVGLVTYHLIDAQCELVTINSLVERQGIGSALVDAVRGRGRQGGLHPPVADHHQRQPGRAPLLSETGFQPGAHAVERSRQLKPEIPLTGQHGIPIRDEIELEMVI